MTKINFDRNIRNQPLLPVFWFTDEDSTISGYKRITTIPRNGSTVTVSAYITENYPTEYVLQSFITDPLENPDIFIVHSGVWETNLWLSSTAGDPMGGETVIGIEVSKIDSNGGETSIYNDLISSVSQNNVWGLLEAPFNVSGFVFNSGDRIAIKIKAARFVGTPSVDRTVYFRYNSPDYPSMVYFPHFGGIGNMYATERFGLGDIPVSVNTSPYFSPYSIKFQPSNLSISGNYKLTLDYSSATSSITAYFTKTGYVAILDYLPQLLISYFPFLRAFWSMSSHNSSGNALAGNGISATLINVNNALYSTNGKVGYVTFNGTNQYLYASDAGDYDITGTEAYIDSSYRGLTIGAWVKPSVVDSTNRDIIGKFLPTGNQRSYFLSINNANRFSFAISSNGSTITSVPNTNITPNTSNWFFVAGRFKPSNEVSIFVNGNIATNTTSIPASIFNSTADFRIGSRGNNTSYFGGSVAFAFLCAGYLPDNILNEYYESTKHLF